jgi:hypothetical protein
MRDTFQLHQDERAGNPFKVACGVLEQSMLSVVQGRTTGSGAIVRLHLITLI